MLDDDPVAGDPTQATTSNCIDAGLERNQSCNICQTPWVDHIGTHRLSQGFVGPGAGCTQSGPLTTGDDLPDIGPAEN